MSDGATGKHILVVNRWDDVGALYHQSIDHRRHRVAYITTVSGLAALVPDLAEEIIVVDGLDDHEQIIACGRALAMRHGSFELVVTLSEFDLELGGDLRAALGVPGPTPADIRRVRDKVTMKQHVARAGVRVPRFTAATSAAAVRAFASEVGLPLILKPRDRAASHGVIEVRTSAQLEDALASIAFDSYECEEFVDGDVYHLDGIVAAGQLLVMRPARCINTDLDFARGERVGSVLNDDAELEARLRSFAVQVLGALGLVTSAFHLELFKRPPSRTGDPGHELVFLEIGARVGGAQVAHIWRDLYGIDLNEVWIRLQLGEPVQLPDLDATSAVGGFMLVPEPADVPCRVEATSSLVGRIPELYAEFVAPVGTILDGHGGYDEIPGRFRFRGRSSAQVEAAIRRAMREYTFQTRPLTAAASARRMAPCARRHQLASLLPRAADLVAAWEERFGALPTHPASVPDPDRLTEAWDAFAGRMADHYPFFHPRYAGQMLKPPHPVAVAGYLAAMLVNPNNHALDGGPGTSALEIEVVEQLAAMFGLPTPALGHLTSSGTFANLEALWVARETHPGRRVVYSAEAHYTHARMCQVLSVEATAVPATADGRIDLDAVQAECARGDVGTVVLTLGTTGVGAIDRIDEALALRERYGVRLHVDAAYGGFFCLLARGEQPEVDPAPFAAVADCDSIVVDPHKHGLQPYGCGAVLFADPAVGRLYKHDSPYTYFTSGDLHLGEISLECSRAGAAAAALWLTLRAFPLDGQDGLAAVLAGARRAALDWAPRLRSSDVLSLHLDPELDIVTAFPAADSLSAVDSASVAVLRTGMEDADDPVFLSVLRVGRETFAARHAGLRLDRADARVLRSVLMKPEHELAVDWLHARVEALAREAL